MKTFIAKTLSVTSLVIISLALGSSAYAEKGAETLVRLTKGSIPAKDQVVATTSYKCAMCIDKLVTIKDAGAKVANQNQTVARHGCNACNTTLVTKGEGKAKTQVAVHSCSADVKAGCCAVN